MSTHPILQPRLGRAAVGCILAQIDTEIRKPQNPRPADDQLAYAAGLRTARQIISDAWEAEAATAAAVAQWLAPTPRGEDA